MENVRVLASGCACLFFFTVSPSAREQGEYYRIIEDTNRTRDFRRGIEALEKAVIERPAEPNFYSNLIFVCIEDRQLERAYRLAADSISRFPEHKYLRQALYASASHFGWERDEKKDLAPSFEALSLAYRHFPDDGSAIRNYGYGLRRQKRLPEAIAVEMVARDLSSG